ncbi:MAG: hypothetical protein WC150_04055 [Bacteroidia bacterium]
MKVKSVIFLVITFITLLLSKVFGQEFPIGIFAGQLRAFGMSAYSHSDSVFIKKWQNKKDTSFYVVPMKKSNKFIMNNIEYSVVYSTQKTPHSLLIYSIKDSIELIKLTNISSTRKIDWEVQITSTYASNGQPYKYRIYYYDTNNVYSYPFYPDSIKGFKNDRDKNIFFMKHGIDYIFYPYNSTWISWIREKGKWKNGKLVKYRKYRPSQKEFKIFYWSRNY